MTLRRSIKQTGGILTLMSLLAILLATVGVTAASAAGLCTRVDNADGTVTLDWDADGDNKWVVRQGTPGNSDGVEVIRITPGWTGGDSANEYAIRYSRQNNIEVACTAVVDPPGFCSVQLLANGDVVLSISDNDANSWAWRRGKNGTDPSYKGEVQNLTATDAAPTVGVYTYRVVSRFGGGNNVTDECGSPLMGRSTRCRRSQRHLPRNR